MLLCFGALSGIPPRPSGTSKVGVPSLGRVFREHIEVSELRKEL